jgi:alpha-glucosidase
MNADKRRFFRLVSALIGVHRRPFLILVLCVGLSSAQDLRTVASPNGQLEFRAFITPPSKGEPDRLAYQILYKGKLLLDTSFVAFEIREQTPLGEKLGLIASSAASTARYHSLIAEYMQNGTTGRRLTLEVRTYDDAVAFRILIPKTSPLEDLFIQQEDTEFHFAADPEVFPILLSSFDSPPKPATATKLSQISPDLLIATPFVARESGIGWISISQAGASGYPRLFLNRSGGATLISALPPLPDHPTLAVRTTTPLLCPWRVVQVGASQDSVSKPLSPEP